MPFVCNITYYIEFEPTKANIYNILLFNFVRFTYACIELPTIYNNNNLQYTFYQTYTTLASHLPPPTHLPTCLSVYYSLYN